MAIADRAVGGTAATSSSITWSHAVAGASNRVLYAFFTAFSGGGDPTSVVFNGSENFTEIADFLGGSGNDNNVSLWVLKNPTATTANIVATFSESGDLTGCSLSYSGVDQTTPNDTPQELDAATVDPTHSITSEVGDMVASFWAGWGLGDIATAGDLTERYEDNNTNGLNSVAIGDAAGAVSVAASWNGTSITDPHGVISININQAAVGGATVKPHIIGGGFSRIIGG